MRQTLSYIQLSSDLPTNPKFYQTRIDLGVDVPTLIGILSLLWINAARTAPEGDISTWTPEYISEITFYVGDCKKLYDILQKHGWIKNIKCAKKNVVLINHWLEYGAGLAISERLRRRKDKEAAAEELRQIWALHGVGAPDVPEWARQCRYNSGTMSVQFRDNVGTIPAKKRKEKKKKEKKIDIPPNPLKPVDERQAARTIFKNISEIWNEETIPPKFCRVQSPGSHAQVIKAALEIAKKAAQETGKQPLDIFQAVFGYINQDQFWAYKTSGPVTIDNILRAKTFPGLIEKALHTGEQPVISKQAQSARDEAEMNEYKAKMERGEL